MRLSRLCDATIPAAILSVIGVPRWFESSVTYVDGRWVDRWVDTHRTGAAGANSSGCPTRPRDAYLTDRGVLRTYHEVYFQSAAATEVPMRVRRALMTAVMVALPTLAQATMYRTDYSGEFGIVDPANGNFTVLGDPGGDQPVSGLCADPSGRLFGSRRTSNSVTDLLEIDRASGALLNTIGTIKNGMANLKITDLACQPDTGVIFGLDSSSPTKLFTIDKTTAAATLVGTTNVERGGLAFSRDGRLYVVSLDEEFAEISPTTAATIGAVLDTGTCLDGFGIRPTDGRAFATLCGDVDTAKLYHINLSTGAADYIADMPDWGTDLDFIESPAAAPAMSAVTLSTLALALCATAAARIRRARQAHA